MRMPCSLHPNAPPPAPLPFVPRRMYQLRNIGTTLFPDAGLSTKLSTTITNGTVTYLPIPGTRDPFTINITRFNNLRGELVGDFVT